MPPAVSGLPADDTKAGDFRGSVILWDLRLKKSYPRLGIYDLPVFSNIAACLDKEIGYGTLSQGSAARWQ